MNLGPSQTIMGTKCWLLAKALGGISSFPTISMQVRASERSIYICLVKVDLKA